MARAVCPASATIPQNRDTVKALDACDGAAARCRVRNRYILCGFTLTSSRRDESRGLA